MLESWVLNRDSLEQLEKGKESRSSLLSSKNYGGLREQGAQGEQQKIPTTNKDEKSTFHNCKKQLVQGIRDISTIADIKVIL